MDLVLILVGVGLLFLGGEGLVRGSVAMAERLNLSTLLVSMVIVGFGTSAPELVVSITAALSGAPNIALGNVVGSNIANILLILGVAAVIAPIACGRREITRDALAVLLASLVLVGLALHGSIGRPAAFVMLAALAAYMSYAYLTERRTTRKSVELRERIEADIGPPAHGLPVALVLCGVGIAFLVAGAHFLVTGATAIASRFGISNAVIGLSLVAVGTSLPELATAIVSAYRKHSDVVIGNIIGSNLFNILGILGVTGLIAPLPVAGRIADVDIWIMLVVAIALSPIIWTGHKISRVEGAVFLVLYCVYVVWLFTAGI
jgi:cation:H+ antiporter